MRGQTFSDTVTDDADKPMSSTMKRLRLVLVVPAPNRSASVQ